MTETGFRMLGGLLQVAGVLLVAWELDAAIGSYAPMHSAGYRMTDRLRRLRSWVARTLRRMLGRRSLDESVTVEGRATIGLTDELHVNLGPGRQAYEAFSTDEERIRHLFRRADYAHESLDNVKAGADQDRQEHHRRFSQLANQLAETDQAWREKVRELEAGSAGRRFAGFATVGYGIIAATWPVELARWDPPAGGLLLVAWLSTLAWAWTRPALPDRN